MRQSPTNTAGASGGEAHAPLHATPAERPAQRVIEVVAGVIRDASGRVLLARRTEGRDLAGLWEFPGGKREADESPEAALVRELHEELGIDVDIGTALINVPQAYPDKRLRLDVRVIDHWRGAIRGREGQALAWVPPHKLASYPMPPADRPVVAALRQPDRYLVTPEPGHDESGWLANLQRALAAGIRRVHLRAPTSDPARWQALATRAVAACKAAGAEVLINADVELARKLGAGVHLRAAQLADLQQRPLPPDQPVAASCHSIEELRAADALGCDFAVVGAVKPTPSHPGASALSWGGFSLLRESVSLPLYAIGGLGIDDIAEARRNGAQGVAAIRSLWPSG